MYLKNTLVNIADLYGKISTAHLKFQRPTPGRGLGTCCLRDIIVQTSRKCHSTVDTLYSLFNTPKDKVFTPSDVECLGSCVNARTTQISDEDLRGSDS